MRTIAKCGNRPGVCYARACLPSSCEHRQTDEPRVLPERAGSGFPLPALASLLACGGSLQMVYSAAAPAAAAVTRIARLTPISTMKLTTRATMPTLRS